MEITRREKFAVVDDEYFHVRCLTCATCHESVGLAYYLGPAGKRYCKKCRVPEKPLKKCSLCWQSISDEQFIKHKNGCFHTQCFKCRGCGGALGLTVHKFAKSSNKEGLFCRDCMTLAGEHMEIIVVENEAPPPPPRICPICETALGDKEPGVKAEGHSFHKACFVCGMCSNPLMGDYFTSSRGRICRACGKKQLLKGMKGKERVCDSCCEPILPGQDYIRTLRGEMHKACFVCTICREPISGSYLPRPDGPYCTPCGSDGIRRKTLLKALTKAAIAAGG